MSADDTQTLFTRFIEKGRIVWDPSKKALACIVDIADANRVLLVRKDKSKGNCGTRYMATIKHLELTDLVIPKLPIKARNRTAIKAWKENKIDTQWDESARCKQLKNADLRHNTTDFERFLVRQAKKERNMEIRKAVHAQKKKK